MTLEVLEPRCESASDGGAGGRTGVVLPGDRDSRARRARRRTAGVSVGADVGTTNDFGVGSPLGEAMGFGWTRGVGNSSSSSCMAERSERVPGWGVVSEAGLGLGLRLNNLRWGLRSADDGVSMIQISPSLAGYAATRVAVLAVLEDELNWQRFCLS